MPKLWIFYNWPFFGPGWFFTVQALFHPQVALFSTLDQVLEASIRTKLAYSVFYFQALSFFSFIWQFQFLCNAINIAFFCFRNVMYGTFLKMETEKAFSTGMSIWECSRSYFGVNTRATLFSEQKSNYFSPLLEKKLFWDPITQNERYWAPGLWIIQWHPRF